MDENELEVFKDSVKKIASKVIPDYQTEKHYNSVPIELFKTLAENGIAGASIGDKYSGTAVSPLVFASIIEELASVDLGVAIFISVHSMVAGLIEKFASENLKNELLPKLASGEMLAAFALTEPGAGSDASALTTRAVQDGEQFIINGEKCYITSAGFADLYLVFASTTPDKGSKGISCFIVRANNKGLKIGLPEKKMGAFLSPIASLTFDNVAVPVSDLVGEVGSGYSVALGGLAGGRLNIAAAAIGLAQHALNLSCQYTCERKQFGQSISDFQGIQFMLADMKTELEAARSLVAHAGSFLSQNPTSKQNRINTSMAKCFASDMAMKVTTDAVQLFGGAGYIADYGVEQLMRDAKMLQIVEGTNQIQRLLIARELLK